MTIYHARRRVTVSGKPVPVTPTEFDLLAELSPCGGTYNRRSVGVDRRPPILVQTVLLRGSGGGGK